MLEAALFPCQTAVHKSTGTTPFKMVYGKETRSPIDITQDEHWNHEHQNGPDEDGSNETRQSNLQKQFKHMIDVLHQVRSTAGTNITDMVDPRAIIEGSQ